MRPQTYLKKRLRWQHDVQEWPYYRRVVGVGFDCEADGDGYFILSDGSHISTSGENAALIWNNRTLHDLARFCIGKLAGYYGRSGTP